MAAPSIRGAALAVLVLGAALVGCGNDNSDAYTDLTEATAAQDVSGRVTVTGSSTVEPVSTLAGEAFRGQNDDVDVSVEGPGTGDGLSKFCAGDADIAGASRPVSEGELDSCRDAGVDPIELAVGLDGIAVVVAPGNPVECVSFADLYALIGPEAAGTDRWSDATELAEALGSDTDLPDENLVLTGPGEESGTYDSLLEIVVEPIAERRSRSGAAEGSDLVGARPDYSSSANDNTIIEGVAADPGGLGWVGFSYAEESDAVDRLAVSEEPDGECVTPSRETIRDGTYPLSRTLFLYVSASAARRSEVAAFVDFYLAALPDLLERTQYISVADPDATVARWEARTTGSEHGG